MKPKIIIGGLVIIIGIVFGAVSFLESSVEYVDIRAARDSHKKVQVKGEWVQDKGTQFDPVAGKFTFFIRDDNSEEMKVVLNGAKPNNFEIAESVVVKGRYRDGYFEATEILTKCPSKYEADADAVRKTL